MKVRERAHGEGERSYDEGERAYYEGEREPTMKVKESLR